MPAYRMRSVAIHGLQRLLIIFALFENGAEKNFRDTCQGPIVKLSSIKSLTVLFCEITQSQRAYPPHYPPPCARSKCGVCRVV